MPIISANILTVDEDYYNLNDILSSRYTLTCTFDHTPPNEFFTYIGQRMPDLTLNAVFSTEVPAWLLCILNGEGIDCVPKVPRMLSQTTRQGLCANPESVNLDNLCVHYYRYGLRIARLIPSSEGRDIVDCLRTVFMKRSGWILRLAVDPGMKPLQLESVEKELFAVAQDEEKHLSSWFHAITEQGASRKRRLH